MKQKEDQKRKELYDQVKKRIRNRRRQRGEGGKVNKGDEGMKMTKGMKGR